MKFNLSIRVFLLSVIIISISACEKERNEVQPTDKWENLHAPNFGQPLDINFVNANEGCVLGMGVGGEDSLDYNIILKTTDGGKTWQSIYLSHRFLIDTIGSMLGGAFLYQYNPNILFAGGLINNLWRSDDGGKHWSKANVTKPPGSSISHFFDPAHGISVGEGVYQTMDSGKTWRTVYKSDAFAFGFTMLQFPSRQTGYAAGGVAFDATNFGMMVKTTDGGNTWQQINYPFHDILSMYFIDDEDGYISVNLNSSGVAGTPPYINGYELYKTTDGGNTWTDVTPVIVLKNKNIISNLYFKNNMEGFCTISGIIYHTVDGGKTWRKDHNRSIYYRCIAFPDNHTSYAIDKAGAILERQF